MVTQEQDTGMTRFPSIGLQGRTVDALNTLAADPGRVLAQYPGIAESGIFNPVSRYLMETVGAEFVFIGSRGRRAVVNGHGITVLADLPGPVRDWQNDARADASGQYWSQR
jgi:hypothetical protein